MRRLTLCTLPLTTLSLLSCGTDTPHEALTSPVAGTQIRSALAAGAPQADGSPVVLSSGFATPESMLYDAVADVYLVSNIGKFAPPEHTPATLDGDGSISRINPETYAVTPWIQHGVNGVTLNGPKGMALLGDVLYVADIDHLRAFHRLTGNPLRSWAVPRVNPAGFLNDLCADASGTLYGTNFQESKLYRFDDGVPVVVAAGTAIGGVNGCESVGNNIVVVAFASTGTVSRVNASSKVRAIGETPVGRLDGIIRIRDWFAISSHGGSAVYAMHINGGQATPIMTGIANPADLGYDTKRHRLLVPRLFWQDVQIQQLK